MAYTGTATTGTGVSALISKYYDKLALEILMPELVLYNLCEKKPLPKNEGKSIVFHRYIARSTMVSAYALTEGGSGAWPTWGLVSSTSVSATVAQYGDAVQVSDLIELTAVSTIVEDTIKLLMQNAANIIDRLIFEVAYGTSSIPSEATFGITWPSAQGYSIGKLSTLTSACLMDVNGIKAAVYDLKRLNVQPKANGFYDMVIDPIQSVKLTSDPAWRDAYMYTTPENLRRGQIGKIAGVEVYETTNVFMTASGTGVANTTSAYFALVLGRGSLAVTEIDGGVKTYVKRPNQYDTANPLNQWSSIGWKINFIPVILNVSCGRILPTTA